MSFVHPIPRPAAATTIQPAPGAGRTAAKRIRTAVGAATALMLLSAPIGSYALAQDAGTRPSLKIDIPTNLTKANVVFNIGHPAFAGDEPIGLMFLQLMSSRFRQDGIEGRLVAVFHGESGYILLGDEAYNRVRHSKGGNPYKAQIAALQAAGVTFEECGTTMLDNHWINGDMLPGVKINDGANFRVVELVQQGYVQLQP